LLRLPCLKAHSIADAYASAAMILERRQIVVDLAPGCGSRGLF
jgi:hypothetical protein